MTRNDKGCVRIDRRRPATGENADAERVRYTRRANVSAKKRNVGETAAEAFLLKAEEEQRQDREERNGLRIWTLANDPARQSRSRRISGMKHHSDIEIRSSSIARPALIMRTRSDPAAKPIGRRKRMSSRGGDINDAPRADRRPVEHCDADNARGAGNEQSARRADERECESETNSHGTTIAVTRRARW